MFRFTRGAMGPVNERAVLPNWVESSGVSMECKWVWLKPFFKRMWPQFGMGQQE